MFLCHINSIDIEFNIDIPIDLSYGVGNPAATFCDIYEVSVVIL